MDLDDKQGKQLLRVLLQLSMVRSRALGTEIRRFTRESRSSRAGPEAELVASIAVAVSHIEKDTKQN